MISKSIKKLLIFCNKLQQQQQQAKNKFIKQCNQNQHKFFVQYGKLSQDQINIIKNNNGIHNIWKITIDNLLKNNKTFSYSINILKNQIKKLNEENSDQEINQIENNKVVKNSNNKIQGNLNNKNDSQQNKLSIEQQVVLINANQLQIQILFLPSKLNLKFQYVYESQTFNLKSYLLKYISLYLSVNQISILTPKTKVSIIDDKLFQKSSDCGNYMFDPFFDSVKFFIQRINGKPLQKTFKVNGLPKITEKQIVNEKQWGKVQNLLGTDSVIQLIKVLCDKKQQSQTYKEKMINLFTKKHGVKLIRDMFEWERGHFQKLQNMQLTWSFQIYEIIQKIRDQSGRKLNNFHKKVKQVKKKCFIDANSNKILRYLVFKVDKQKLQKLSKILRYNMQKAIQIVKEQIVNEALLNKLENYFYQYCDVPKKNQQALKTSSGLILFGPPGTGKTQLTQSLPNLIGFHLISQGLSAADFMKSYVGQSSRMINDLVNRATLSPHLICSVGIDQVDGLVPDRKDKDQKNKTEGVSMLLSVIGGNKDVPNLLFFTSTNHLKKIDQAIKRRLSGQFLVGRPNVLQRRKLLKDNLQFLKNDGQILGHLEKITINFTGAALKGLTNSISLYMRKMRQNSNYYQLSINQVTSIAAQIARQFSITIGVYTFPQIYSSRTNKNNIMTIQFLGKIANRFLLIKSNANSVSQFVISYANRIVSFQYDIKTQQKIQYDIYEAYTQTLNIQKIDNDNPYSNLKQWLNKSICNKKIKIKIISENQKKELYQKYNTRTVIFIKASHITIQWIKSQNLFQKPIENVCFIYYCDKYTFDDFYKLLKWNSSAKKKYTGRVLVQLKNQAKMAFQLQTSEEEQTELAYKYFMKTQQQNKPNDILPQLVDFFTQRKVKFILLIDFQLLLQNAAYQQQKMIEIIQQKMAQAVNYEKVAVILNVDSLIVLNQSSSDSSMGRSTSYSVSDQNMYRLLLNYMKQFATIRKQSSIKENNKNMKQEEKSDKKKTIDQQKWFAIIVKDQQLSKLIKKNIDWPLSNDQKDQQKQEKAKDQDRKCVRCGISYTQRQNQRQKKCMQHPGPLINRKDKVIEKTISLRAAKSSQMLYKQKNAILNNSDNKKNKSIQNIFVYACCLKGLNDQGQGYYRHITKQQQKTQKDQLYLQRKQNEKQWQQVLRSLDQ